MRFTLVVDEREHAAVRMHDFFVLDTFRKVPFNKYASRRRSTACTHNVVPGMPAVYAGREALVMEVNDDGTLHLEFCDDGIWYWNLEITTVMPRMGMNVDAFLDAYLNDEAPAWTVVSNDFEEYLVPAGASEASRRTNVGASGSGADSYGVDSGAGPHTHTFRRDDGTVQRFPIDASYRCSRPTR